MLYLGNSGTTTLTVWPEVSSSYFPGSGSLRLKVTDDYSEEVTYIPATLLNVPTQFTPRLIFSVTSSDVPAEGGQYTAVLQEYLEQSPIWGETQLTFGEADFTWSDTGISGIVTLDTDRAFVQGTDTPAQTQYTSPDETGRYSIYNG